MKKLLKYCVSFSLCLFALNSSFAQKLLLAGCGWNQIVIIDKKTGNKDWIYNIPNYAETNDAEFTKDKNILYTNKRNACLVNLKKEQLWEYKANAGEEIHTATQLVNRHYLLGICGNPSRIAELDKNGKLVKDITFDTKNENAHAQFRQIYKSKKGTFLVPLFAGKKVLEVNVKGEIVTQTEAGFPLFSIKELANGNWLLSGEGARVVELNPKTKEIVRTIDNSKLEGAKLLFTTEALPLRNGNILICNWNGHSKDKTQPKLIEVDKANKIIWSLKDDPEIKNLSAVYLIDSI